MLYQVFLGLAGLLGTRESITASIDDIVFRLHYKFTTAMLFLFCILISVSDLVGMHFQIT